MPTSTGTRYWLDETCWAQVEHPSADPGAGGAAARSGRPLGETGLPGSTVALQTGSGRGTGVTEGRAQPSAVEQVLLRAGIAVERVPHRPLEDVRVAVVGAGKVGRALAASLLRAGVPGLWLFDPAPPPRQVWPDSRFASSGQALAASLRTRRGVRAAALGSLGELLAVPADVVLVASTTVEPDRVLLDALVRAELPHLVLRCHREVARLGPLVLPGRAPCLGCHDLARAVDDPQWPQVLAHLCQVPAAPDVGLADHLASRAVLEVGWMARDLARRSALEGRVEVVDLRFPGTRRAGFAHHPACTCRA